MSSLLNKEGHGIHALVCGLKWDQLFFAFSFLRVSIGTWTKVFQSGHGVEMLVFYRKTWRANGVTSIFLAKSLPPIPFYTGYKTERLVRDVRNHAIERCTVGLTVLMLAIHLGCSESINYDKLNDRSCRFYYFSGIFPWTAVSVE